MQNVNCKKNSQRQTSNDCRV